MFVCKPERSVKQARLLLWVSVFVVAGLFFVATYIQSYASLTRLMAFVALMAAILLNVRFTLTEYEYCINGGDFSVIKITGNRRQTICCVALETAIGLLEKRDYDHLPSDQKAIIKYSLNQNMKAQSYVFLCEFNGKRAMIEFEPNEAFVTIMKREISNYIKEN